MRAFATFFLFTAPIITAIGFASNDPNIGLHIDYDSVADEVTVTWDSEHEHFYFLLTTEDLADEPWAYFDFATLGNGSVQGRVIQASPDKLFFIVDYTNDVNSPLLVLDQDGDKVSTADELLQDTDPFLSESLDADTIPDDWETFHGLDTTPGVDSSGGDEEPDGASNMTEFALNLNPSERDHPDVSLNLY